MVKPHSSPSYEAKAKAARRGKSAEDIAALYLTLKGYRVLARRYKTRAGEIDIIARRAKRIVFVEVKQRPSFSLCEQAVSPETRSRVRHAADLWMARNETYQGYEQGYDLIFIANWRLPRHLLNAL